MDFVVTCYENPDLDALACSYAYAEFLRKNGKDADYAVFGQPLAEATFVAKKAGIKVKKKLDTRDAKFILVDSSFLSDLSGSIKPGDVVEIIDHRKLNEAHIFMNARVQVELVGAAATLIAEKFMQSRTRISRESRVLLFYAIISNTVNFKSNVTTERDRKAAAWLGRGLKLKKGWLNEFFAAKSRITNLRKSIEGDAVIRVFGGRKFLIGQLEIVDAWNFAVKKEPRIRGILNSLAGKKMADFSFLTIVDIEKAENVFFTDSEEVKKAILQAVGAGFRGSLARNRGIIMRKELSPLLDKYFRKNTNK